MPSWDRGVNGSKSCARYDETGPRMRWVQSWDTWLRRHRWDFFATLTWAESVGESRAQHDVAGWWARVQRKHPSAAAVVSFELSPGGRLHVHALVYLDGQRYGLPILAGQWHLGHPRAWRHGNTKVVPFRPYRHPGRGAAAYVVKGLTDIELYGQRMPPAYQPRR